MVCSEEDILLGGDFHPVLDKVEVHMPQIIKKSNIKDTFTERL